MHRATQRRTTLLRFLLPAALLVAACDRDELEELEPEGDRAAMAVAGDADDSPREHARRGKGHGLDRLCAKLECTDEQRGRIEGLAQRLKAERPEPAGDRDAANRALAQAFGGHAFSVGDLQAWHAAAGRDADASHAALAEAVGELHGLLDAEQRATLAEKIERRGLPFLGGGAGGKHHGKGSEKRAARLCEAVACTGDQEARIAALLQAPPEAGQVPQAEREALARAFRGESLPEAAVTAYLDAAAKARAEQRAALDAKAVELHALLTPEQRAILVGRIAAKGPKALGLYGGKGKGHRFEGKGHHGKGHRFGGKKAGRGGNEGRRGPGPQGEAQQFG